MGDVTALGMDTVTEKSGHQVTGMAVSVCITPAAPAPLPIPYPTMGTVSEGIVDGTLRTKINGSTHATVGSCVKVCHGNEAGTLKEVVSLNTAGPSFLTLGAPTVLVELGMAGITGSLVQMNKAITVGASDSASDAGGDASGGGAGAGGGGGGDPNGPGNASNGGGGGGGSHTGAAPPSPPAPPGATGQAHGGHPVDVITGAMFENPTLDFWLTGFVNVQLYRSYRTSSVERRCGIGWGWSHSLHWQGTMTGGVLTLVDPDLRPMVVPLPDTGAVRLPFGRSLWRQRDEIVIDLRDGLFRILRRVGDTSTFVLAQIRDEFDHFAELEWDRGELVGIVDSVGREARLHKAASTLTWVATVRDEGGTEHKKTLVTYQLDQRGDLVNVVDSGGFETTYAYDDEHYLVAETRPDGIVYRFVYADAGGVRRCVETWGEKPGADILAELGDPDARSSRAARGLFHTRFAYGPDRFESTMTDAVGAVHRYRGNALGLVERYTDPRGYVRQYVYDPEGLLLSSTDGNGRAIHRTYDGDARETAVRLRDGSIHRRKYDREASTTTQTDAGGRPVAFKFVGTRLVASKDSRGRSTVCQYNEDGRVAQITHPNGTAEVFEYDAHGNIRLRSRPYAGTYEYTFDLFGLPVRVKNGAGLEVRFEYDGRGDLVRLSEPGGKVTEHQLDSMHNVRARRDPNGAIWRFRHVDTAAVERVAPDGRRWTLGYDALLRLRWVTNPAGERYSREYDPSGNVVRETSFSGVTTEREYDGANMVVREVRADGSTVRFVRDGEGRLLDREHSDGRTDRFEYDVDGRLSRATNAASTVSFARNREGRVLRDTQECGGWKFVTDYTYDDIGDIVEKRYSSGWACSMQRREADGAIIGLRASADEEEQLRFEYDARGAEITRRSAGSGAIHTDRDLYGLPTRIRMTGPDGATVRERSYDWAVGGPVTRVVDTVQGARKYEIDAAGRPLRVEGLGADEAFEYSPQGTPVPRSGGWMLGRDGRPVQTARASLVWDERGRLAGRREADGNVSWSYAYDGNDRLVTAERSDGLRVQYLYDPLGRRIAEVRGDGTSTWFGWDGDTAIEEQRSDGRRVQRVFAADQSTPLLEARDGRGWRVVATDGAGTPFAYLAGDQSISDIELTAWGEVAHERGDAGGLRFAGQRADDVTGLHYNRHRYYAPDLHVFTTPDPLGVAASLQDVGFVPNATLYIDPMGLTTIVLGAPGDAGIEQNMELIKQAYPGARVISCADLQRRDEAHPNGILYGEDHVILQTHGAPGSLQFGPAWGASNVNGYQFGQQLTAAGFGGGPNAKVDLYACNSATPQQGGGISSAQGLQNALGGAQVSGAASHYPDATYAGWTYPGSPWGPGMMCPSGPGRDPYVCAGQWATLPAQHPVPTPRGPTTLRGPGP